MIRKSLLLSLGIFSTQAIYQREEKCRVTGLMTSRVQFDEIAS